MLFSSWSYIAVVLGAPGFYTPRLLAANYGIVDPAIIDKGFHSAVNLMCFHMCEIELMHGMAKALNGLK